MTGQILPTLPSKTWETGRETVSSRLSVANTAQEEIACLCVIAMKAMTVDGHANICQSAYDLD